MNISEQRWGCRNATAPFFTILVLNNNRREPEYNYWLPAPAIPDNSFVLFALIYRTKCSLLSMVISNLV